MLPAIATIFDNILTYFTRCNITSLHSTVIALRKQKLRYFPYVIGAHPSYRLHISHWVFTSPKVRKWPGPFRTVGSETKSRESFRESCRDPDTRSFIFLISAAHKLIHPLPPNVARNVIRQVSIHCDETRGPKRGAGKSRGREPSSIAPQRTKWHSESQ